MQLKKIKKIKPFSFSAKEFITAYYIPRYKELFGFPPQIVWGKDLSLLRKLCKEYYKISLEMGFSTLNEFLIFYCESYFKMSGGWPKKSGYSIGVFYKTIPGLLIDNKQIDKKTDLKEKEVQQGFKVAYLNYFEQDYKNLFPYESKAVFNKIYDFLFNLRKINTNKTVLNKFDFVNLIEIYFLFIFDSRKIKITVNFDYLATEKLFNSFINWLDADGKELLFFMPKKTTPKSKNIELDTKISDMEDFILLHLDKAQKREFSNWLLQYTGDSESLYDELTSKIIMFNLLAKFQELNK